MARRSAQTPLPLYWYIVQVASVVSELDKAETLVCTHTHTLNNQQAQNTDKHMHPAQCSCCVHCLSHLAVPHIWLRSGFAPGKSREKHRSKTQMQTRTHIPVSAILLPTLCLSLRTFSSRPAAKGCVPSTPPDRSRLTWRLRTSGEAMRAFRKV